MLRRWKALPGNVQWLMGALAAVVLILVVAWVLLVPVANWLANNDVGQGKPSQLVTARDAARGRLLTLGAGLIAAGALVFTARSFILSREGHVTDRYSKAVEQLGSDKLDVRIGGIYALERIARDSPRDHPMVMEVLTTFIREHLHEPWPPPGDSAPQARARSIRTDVQAALTVVGRRDARRDKQAIDLTRADLSEATLTDAKLAGACLIPRGSHRRGALRRGSHRRDAHRCGPHWRDVKRGERPGRGTPWSQVAIYQGRAPGLVSTQAWRHPEAILHALNRAPR
jgi:hypothetical protein